MTAGSGNIQQRLLDALKAGPASTAQLYRLTGLGEDSVQQALSRLVAAGLVERQARGLYALKAAPPPPTPSAGPSIARLWRGMCAAKQFTRRQIAGAAGAHPDNTKKFITWLLLEGYVRQVGQDGPRAVYQVVPSRRGRAVPPYRRRAPRTWVQERQDLVARLEALKAQVEALTAPDLAGLPAIEAEAGRLKDTIRRLRQWAGQRGAS